MSNALHYRLVVILAVIISNLSIEIAEGQSIQLIPNPDAGTVDAPGIIAYKNNVYVGYRNVTGTVQLAQYNGASLKLIPNPDAGNIVAYSGMIIYNNKLYFHYKNVSNNIQLGEYDGTSMTQISYPAGTGSVRLDSSIVYNNKLYFKNRDSAGIYHLLEFDGTNITLLPNLDKGGGFSNITTRIVYNNKLYLTYLNASNHSQLIQFDGTSWTFIPNPDAGEVYSYSEAAIYNNNLYFKYINASGTYQLAQFDGKSIELIPNPDSKTTPSFLLPVVFNDKLYMTYHTTNSNLNTNLVAEFDGSSIKLIPKPNVSMLGDPNAIGDGCWGKFVKYNNKLYISYFAYYSQQGEQNLAEFDGTTLTLIPRISSSSTGGWGIAPVDVFDNKLIVSNILRLEDYYNHYGLAEYNGSSFNFISNPNIGDVSTFRTLIYNNRFYFQYGYQAPDGTFPSQLAYLESGTLPITLLNLKGQLQDNNVLLQWQTATEQNSNHFTVQRSQDGIHFSDVGSVKAAGNSSTIKSYNYTDPAVVKLGLRKLFYRVQEVDNDEKKQLSNIVSLDITNANSKFIAYPNPAKNMIELELPYALSQTAQIVLYDLNGRKVMQQKPQLNNQHQLLKVNNLPQGNYNLQVIEGSKKLYSTKVVVIH